MEPTWVGIAESYGPLGISAAFVAWLYIKETQKREKLITSFQDQIREMQDRCDSQMAETRARYDTVVERYNQERDTLLQGMTSNLDNAVQGLHDVNEKIEKVGGAVASGLSEMRQHYAALEARRDQ
jgi:DNA anti-recombination protein RmuC